MPAKSKAQQQAAGIALAAKRGSTPKSKLRGASKSMASMKGGELNKFASTKTGGLPKHVKEGTEAVANLFGQSLLEKGHRSGCTCGFCKNKGSFGKKAKADEKNKEKQLAEPSEPEPVKESGTDVKRSTGVNLGGPAASAYHSMTSKQAMTPGWKPKAYIKAAGELSGNTKHGQTKGFKNRSAAETTTGKHIESRVPGAAAKQIVEALLG